MNLEKVFRHRALRAGIPALALFTAGCLFSGKDDPAASPSAAGGSEARLQLLPAPLAKALAKTGAAAAVPFDSVAVRVTGDDMAPLEFSFAGDSLAVTLAGLPPGPNRSVEAALFRSGRLLYQGRSLCEFKKEARLDLSLRCDPQFSRVYSRFHLPVGLRARVSDGSLRLAAGGNQWTARLRIEGEFGTFLLDEMPGNARYDLTVTLSDSAGKAVYQSDRAGLYLPLGEEAHWDLQLLPTEAEAGVYLRLAEPGETDLAAGFPSRRRKPARAGEVIVTEFYASPAVKDSSSEGEWWEVFNRSADTLAMGGCRLSRDRLGGVTRSYAFDSALSLPPGRAVVFGRSAARADYHYKDFSLVNTSASLLLLCSGDSLALDSLRYSAAPADSQVALPIRDGHVTTLDAAGMGRSASPGAWCLTTLADSTLDGEPGFASPGTVTGCGK
jgi:hypothetical protein